MNAAILSSAVGSSPHTRGTRRWPGPCARRCRFIPAYAGNAGSHRWRPNEDAVHPRIRGERPNSPALAISCIGSSPHTRGTRIMQSERFASKSVHPRIRGERDTAGLDRFKSGGSSPHTRGTLLRAPALLPVWRFIPAYAGNAYRTGGVATSVSVHPRIRGERPAALLPWLAWAGSSPHTRGTLLEDNDAQPARRFIPAYAGNAPGSASSNRI